MDGPQLPQDILLEQKFKEILAILDDHPNPAQAIASITEFATTVSAVLQNSEQGTNATNSEQSTHHTDDHASSPNDPALEDDADLETYSSSSTESNGRPTKKRKQSTKSQSQSGASKPRRDRRSKIKRPLTLTKKLRTPKDLTALSVGMSRQYPIAKLQWIQRRFCTELLNLPKPEGDRHKTPEGQDPSKLFDQASAAKLSQYFFENTMGECGLAQVSQFVCDYTPLVDHKVDSGAANRLRSVATDPRAPPILQNFCASLSAELAREQDDQSVIGHLGTLNRALATFETYQKVCQKIDNGQTQIWSYINSVVDAERIAAIRSTARVETTSGVSHASVAYDVLAAVAQIDRKILVNRIDRTRALDLVVKKLGRGFVLLMPVSSMSFLRDIGVGRLGPACDALLRHCPYIPPFVQLLEKHIWQPYQQGVRELPVNVRYLEPTSDDACFLDQLQNAVNNFRATRTITDTDAAMDDGEGGLRET